MTRQNPAAHKLNTVVKRNFRYISLSSYLDKSEKIIAPLVLFVKAYGFVRVYFQSRDACRPGVRIGGSKKSSVFYEGRKLPIFLMKIGSLKGMD
jgi:hypothetical protein